MGWEESSLSLPGPPRLARTRMGLVWWLWRTGCGPERSSSKVFSPPDIDLKVCQLVWFLFSHDGFID